MDLTKGKVSTALLKFTMPIILMQILNQAYMVADSVIVARFVNETALSIGTMALQVIVNRAGVEYINGYTVATTIFNLLLLPIVATSVGFQTFASKNIGAKQEQCGTGNSRKEHGGNSNHSDQEKFDAKADRKLTKIHRCTAALSVQPCNSCDERDAE